MTLLHKFVAAAVVALSMWSSSALGDCNGQFAPGAVCNNPETGQKPPVSTVNPVIGGNLTVKGETLTSASTTARSGLNVPQGVAPTSPVNGDIWNTTAGTFVRINGVTVGPLSGPSAASFAATPPLAVAFPAGVVTYSLNYDATLAVSGGNLGINLAHSNIWTAAQSIVTTSSFAFQVAATGQSGNPALLVSTSAGTQTGIQLQSQVGGAGMYMETISPAANEALLIDAKGAGGLILQSIASGPISLDRATTLNAALTYGGVTLANSVTGTGSMVLSDSPVFTTSLTVPVLYGGNLTTSGLTISDTSNGSSTTAGIFFRSRGGLAVTPTLNQGAPGTTIWQQLATNMSISPSGKWIGLTGTPTTAFDAQNNCMYPQTVLAQPDTIDVSFVECGSYYNVDQTITGITKANPAVVTVPTANIPNGSLIVIEGVVGMTQVNNTRFVTTTVDANHLSIGVDSTGYSSYVSGGTATIAQGANMRSCAAYVYGKGMDVNCAAFTLTTYDPTGGGDGLAAVGNCAPGAGTGGVCYGVEIATNCFVVGQDCGGAVAAQFEAGGGGLGTGATRAYTAYFSGAPQNSPIIGMQIIGDAFSPIQPTGDWLRVRGTFVSMANGFNWTGATFSGCGYLGPTGSLCLSGTDKITGIAAGSGASPSIRFGTDTGTGFYSVAANQIGLAINGANAPSVVWTSGGMQLAGGFPLSMNGSSSGGVNIQAQTNAGTPTIVWGTSSGTVVATAASPLSRDATTGQVSCPTCATTAGANIPTIAQGDILYGSAANTLSALGKSTTATRYLANTGSSNNPQWDQVSLSTGATGTLQAGQFPAMTGDVTSTAGSLATTLATVNSNIGNFGSATQTPSISLNGKGLITAASSVTITPAVGSITGLGTGVATALAVNGGNAGAFITFNGALGTPSSGIATNLTGTASGLTAGNVTTNTITVNGASCTLGSSCTTAPAVTSLLINCTYDLSTASGTKTYPNATDCAGVGSFGFQPSSCDATGTVNGSAFGVYVTFYGHVDSALHQGSLFSQSSSFQNHSTISIFNVFDAAGANSVAGAVTAFNATTLTMTWTKTASPTGSFAFSLRCFK